MEYPFIGLAIAALVVAGNLRDCGNMSRFERETYTCTETQAPFSRLSFNSLNIGDSGQVHSGKNPRATITQVDEAHLKADWDGGYININRDTGTVTVTQDGMVRSYPCKKSLFTM